MFWDGSRWIDERANADGRIAARAVSKHGSYITLAISAVLIGLTVLSVSSVQPVAAGYRSGVLTASWGTGYTMDIVQESARAVATTGTWLRKTHSGFLGRHVLTSWDRGATITYRFTGTGIAIVGPTSRQRGKARLYIDGKYLTTINTHSRKYHRHATLFATSWTTEQTHTVSITVLGRTRATKFSVDAFLVRHPKDKAKGQPSPLPTTRPSPTTKPADPTKAPNPSVGPLEISAVSAHDVADTSAKVTWTVSEPATGQIEYGTSTRYGQMSSLEPSFDYSTHVQALSGLIPGTQYHFRTHSTAADGRSAYSADHTFTTSPAGAAPTPSPTSRPTAAHDPDAHPRTHACTDGGADPDACPHGDAIAHARSGRGHRHRALVDQRDLCQRCQLGAQRLDQESAQRQHAGVPVGLLLPPGQ